MRRCAAPAATLGQARHGLVHLLLPQQQQSQVGPPGGLVGQELDRLTQLVPDEAAGWANLGLLLLRQQQMDEAATRLARASQLAPRNAAIERLLALTESRTGNLEASVRHWRRAIELDPADLKAPYALAQELERLGGPANDAEAQRLFDTLAARSGNLAAKLEFARVAARRADAAALARALDALAQHAPSWPADAQERLKTVRQAARDNPAAAATSVIFLKNVLIREPEYRAALAAVSTPRAEVGEPMVRLISLPNPDPQPAAADDQLAFLPDASPAVAVPAAAWAGALWLTGEGAPALVSASPRELRVSTGVTVAFPANAAFGAAGPDAVAAVDLNYDFRTDLVFAGASGLQIFRQTEKGGFTAVTADARLPADVTSVPLHAVWPADIDTDGDLDLVVAPRDGAVRVLRNNGDDTFAAQSPFGTLSRVRGFAWADLDGEGVPDAALLDDQGVLRVFLNLRGSAFRERAVPGQFPRVAALAIAELSGDGIVDVLGIGSDGTVTRLSTQLNGSNFEAARVARFDAPSGLAPGNARLLVADLDNNGAGDLIASAPGGSRIALASPDGNFRQASGQLPGGITAAADLDGDGRLELVVLRGDGAGVVRVKGQKNYRWQAIRPRAVTATGDQRINSFGVGGEVEVRTGLARPEAGHRRAGRALRPWRSHACRGRPDHVAQRLPAVGVRPHGGFFDRREPAAQRIVSVAVRLEREGNELRHRLHLALPARPAHQRAGDRRRADDGRLGQDPGRPARAAQRPGTISRSPRSCGRRTSSISSRCSSSIIPKAAKCSWTSASRCRRRGSTRSPPRRCRTSSACATIRAATSSTSSVPRDDRHLDFAGRGRYQGVTREHFVELELPEEAPRTGPLWLVAQGWIHPTDSSINVALGQGNHAPPAGLSLQVADTTGLFRPARAGLGFPAGKDKTVLIDLAGLFPAKGPRRVRLSTNLEIFWDRMGWAAGRPDVTLQPRKLDMKTADLRFRGYSVTDQKDASTPERPRYVIGGVASRWRDLEGFHTRFGDVRELLQTVDDRYVIMNAGDELLLAFPEAPPPPKGFVRDFVLVGDGWVKDGDFNTVASRTVLPLPTHQSPRYAPGTGRLEDDPVYRRHKSDFERYHTRYVSPDGARDALRAKIVPDHP